MFSKHTAVASLALSGLAAAARIPLAMHEGLPTKDPNASFGEVVPQGVMDAYVKLHGMQQTERGPLQYSCGATALEGGWLLSAAHCVVDDDRQPASSLYFTVYDRSGDSRTIVPMNEAEMYIPAGYHPSMRSEVVGDKYYGDIALIRLPQLANRDISYPTLPISREEVDAAPTLVAIGMGLTETDEVADKLEFVSLYQDGRVGEASTTGIDAYSWLEEDHFVARDMEKEGQNTCGGDSGSGVFIPNKDWDEATSDPNLDRNARDLTNDRNVLVGVTSWGPVDCGVTDDPWGAYTDVHFWLDWIQATVSGDNTPTEIY